MPQYSKTKLPSPLSVSTLTTIFCRDMSADFSRGGELHNFCEIIYVHQGTHTLAVDSVPYTLATGQLMLYAPNTHHRMVGRSRAMVGIISFEGSDALSPLYNRPLTLNRRQRDTLWDIVQLGTELFCPVDEENGLVGMVPREGVTALQLQELKLRLELFLLDLYKSDRAEGALRAAVNRENYRAAQLDFLRSYLARHLGEGLTLERMAADCSMSVSKIKEIFKQNRMCSPMRYFTVLKIEEAKRLMAETALNLTEISERLGFSSVHYFSKVFKDNEGVCPSAYLLSLTQ